MFRKLILIILFVLFVSKANALDYRKDIFDRVGTTISPSVANDNISTSGNIYIDNDVANLSITAVNSEYGNFTKIESDQTLLLTSSNGYGYLDGSEGVLISPNGFGDVSYFVSGEENRAIIQFGYNVSADENKLVAMVLENDGYYNWHAQDEYVKGYKFDRDVYVNGRVKAFDGTNKFLIAQKIKYIDIVITSPALLGDPDLVVIWINESEMDFHITEVKASADVTAVSFIMNELTSDTNYTVLSQIDAFEIDTAGTGMYYTSDNDIANPIIESGHPISIDFDQSDTPKWVKIKIKGWYDADVD